MVILVVKLFCWYSIYY